MADPNVTEKLGLVLSAGGARAAYQVGVLRHLGKHMPGFFPKIFTGISAGSINAAFLSQGRPIEEATEQMYQLWKALKFEEVMNTNFKSFFNMSRRLSHDLFFSRWTKKKLFTSILDATPLSVTLLKHIQFPKVVKAIESGDVQGLAVSTTNYNTGENTVFFDSHDDIAPWQRPRRNAVRTPIRIRHIMASCSIPLLFEPVKIGNYFYGDGAMRFRFPLSPAIHLGARKILALGINSKKDAPANVPGDQLRLSTGLVAGVVLNSIFVDALETDYEHLKRLNEVAERNSKFNHIDVCMLRPSQDLGKLARSHIEDLPFHLRQFLNASAESAAELGDLISYLMFTKEYIGALMDLGEKDAETDHDRISDFLQAQPDKQTAAL